MIVYILVAVSKITTIFYIEQNTSVGVYNHQEGGGDDEPSDNEQEISDDILLAELPTVGDCVEVKPKAHHPWTLGVVRILNMVKGKALIQYTTWQLNDDEGTAKTVSKCEWFYVIGTCVRPYTGRCMIRSLNGLRGLDGLNRAWYDKFYKGHN